MLFCLLYHCKLLLIFLRSLTFGASYMCVANKQKNITQSKIIYAPDALRLKYHSENPASHQTKKTFHDVHVQRIFCLLFFLFRWILSLNECIVWIWLVLNVKQQHRDKIKIVQEIKIHCGSCGFIFFILSLSFVTFSCTLFAECLYVRGCFMCIPLFFFLFDVPREREHFDFWA